MTIFISVVVIGVIANSCQDHSAGDGAGQQHTEALTAQQRAHLEADEKSKRDADARSQAVTLMANMGGKQLKNSMRDPDSFKVALAINTGAAIFYQYRARNGFGGMNVGYAVLRLDTGKMTTGSADEPPGGWQRHCAKKTGPDLAAEIAAYLAR